MSNTKSIVDRLQSAKNASTSTGSGTPTPQTRQSTDTLYNLATAKERLQTSNPQDAKVQSNVKVNSTNVFGTKFNTLTDSNGALYNYKKPEISAKDQQSLIDTGHVTFGTAVADATKSALANRMAGIEGSIGFVKDALGMDANYNYLMSSALSDRAGESQQNAMYGQNKVAETALQTMMSSIDMALDLVNPASYATAAGQLLPMGLRVFGSEAANERMSGGSIGYSTTVGVIRSGIEVLTEKIFGSPLFPYIGKVEGLTDKLVEKVGAKLGSTLVPKLIQSFGGEFVEELLSGILNYTADTWILGKAQDHEGFLDELPDMLYEGLIGGLTGLLFGGAEIVTNKLAGADVQTALSQDIKESAAKIRQAKENVDSIKSQAEEAADKIKENKGRVFDESSINEAEVKEARTSEISEAQSNYEKIVKEEAEKFTNKAAQSVDAVMSTMVQNQVQTESPITEQTEQKMSNLEQAKNKVDTTQFKTTDDINNYYASEHSDVNAETDVEKLNAELELAKKARDNAYDIDTHAPSLTEANERAKAEGYNNVKDHLESRVIDLVKRINAVKGGLTNEISGTQQSRQHAVDTSKDVGRSTGHGGIYAVLGGAGSSSAVTESAAEPVTTVTNNHEVTKNYPSKTEIITDDSGLTWKFSSNQKAYLQKVSPDMARNAADYIINGGQEAVESFIDGSMFGFDDLEVPYHNTFTLDSAGCHQIFNAIKEKGYALVRDSNGSLILKEMPHNNPKLIKAKYVDGTAKISVKDALDALKEGKLLVEDARSIVIGAKDFIVNTPLANALETTLAADGITSVFIEAGAPLFDSKYKPIMHKGKQATLGELLGGVTYNCNDGFITIQVVYGNSMNHAETAKHEVTHVHINAKAIEALSDAEIISRIGEILGTSFDIPANSTRTKEILAEAFIKTVTKTYQNNADNLTRDDFNLALEEAIADCTTVSQNYMGDLLVATSQLIYEKCTLTKPLPEEAAIVQSYLAKKLKDSKANNTREVFTVTTDISQFKDLMNDFEGYSRTIESLNKNISDEYKAQNRIYKGIAQNAILENVDASAETDVLADIVKADQISGVSEEVQIAMKLIEEAGILHSKISNSQIIDETLDFINSNNNGEIFNLNGESVSDEVYEKIISDETFAEAIDRLRNKSNNPRMRAKYNNELLSEMYSHDMENAIKSGVDPRELTTVDNILNGTAPIGQDGMYHLMGGITLDVNLAKMAAKSIYKDAKSGKYMIRRRTGGTEVDESNKNIKFGSKNDAFQYFCNIKAIYQRPFFQAMSAANNYQVPKDFNGTPIGESPLRLSNGELTTAEGINPFEYSKANAWDEDSHVYVPTTDGDAIGNNYIIQTSSAVNDELAYQCYVTAKYEPSKIPERFKTNGKVDPNKFNQYVDEGIVILKLQSTTELSNFVHKYMKNGVMIGGQNYKLWSITDSDQKQNKVRLMRETEYDSFRALYNHAGVGLYDEGLLFNPVKEFANQGKDNSPSYRQRTVDARKCVVLPDVEKNILKQHGFMVTNPLSSDAKSIDNYAEVWSTLNDSEKELVKKRIKMLREHTGDVYEELDNGMPDFKAGDVMLKNEWGFNFTDGAAVYELQGRDKGTLGKVQFRGESGHCLKGIMHEMPIMSMLVDSGITELTDYWGNKVKIVETDAEGNPLTNPDGTYKLLKNGILFESTVKMISAEKYNSTLDKSVPLFGAWNAEELSPEKRAQGQLSFCETLGTVMTATGKTDSQGLPEFEEEPSMGIRFMEKGNTYAFNDVESVQGEDEIVGSFTQVLRSWLMNKMDVKDAATDSPMYKLVDQAIDNLNAAIDGEDLDRFKNLLGADEKSQRADEILAAIMPDEYFSTAKVDKQIRSAFIDTMEKLSAYKVPMKGTVVNATLFPELVAVARGIEAMQKGESVDNVTGVLKEGEIYNSQLSTRGVRQGRTTMNSTAVLRSPTQQLSDQNIMKNTDITNKQMGDYFYTTDDDVYRANKYAIKLNADVMYQNVNDLLSLKLDNDFDGDTARLIQSRVLVNALDEYLSKSNDELLTQYGDYNVIEFKHGKAPKTYCTVENLAASIRNSLQGESIGITDTFLSAIYGNSFREGNSDEIADRYRLAAIFSVAYKLSTDVFKTGYYPQEFAKYINAAKEIVGYKRQIRPQFTESEKAIEAESEADKLHGKLSIKAPTDSNIGKKQLSIYSPYAPELNQFKSPSAKMKYESARKREERFKLAQKTVKSGFIPQDFKFSGNVTLSNGLSWADVRRKTFKEKLAWLDMYVKEHPETDELGRATDVALSQTSPNNIYTWKDAVFGAAKAQDLMKVKTKVSAYDKPGERYVGKVSYTLKQGANKFYKPVKSSEIGRTCGAKIAGFESFDAYHSYYMNKFNQNAEIANTFERTCKQIGKACTQVDNGRISFEALKEYITKGIAPFKSFNINTDDVINCMLASSFIEANLAANGTTEAELKKNGFKYDYDSATAINDRTISPFDRIANLFTETLKTNLNHGDGSIDFYRNVFNDAINEAESVETNNWNNVNMYARAAAPSAEDMVFYSGENRTIDTSNWGNHKEMFVDEYEVDSSEMFGFKMDNPFANKTENAIPTIEEIVEEAPVEKNEEPMNYSDNEGNTIDTSKTVAERRTSHKLNISDMEKQFSATNDIQQFEYKDVNGNSRSTEVQSANRYFESMIKNSENKTIEYKLNENLAKDSDTGVVIPRSKPVTQNLGMIGTKYDCRDNIIRYTWTNMDVMSNEEITECIHDIDMFLADIPDAYKDDATDDYIAKAKRLMSALTDETTRESALLQMRKELRKASERFEHVTNERAMSVEIQAISSKELANSKLMNKLQSYADKTGNKVISEATSKLIDFSRKLKWERVNMQTVLKSLDGYKPGGIGHNLATMLNNCGLNKDRYMAMCNSFFKPETLRNFNNASEEVKLGTTMCMYLDMITNFGEVAPVFDERHKNAFSKPMVDENGKTICGSDGNPLVGEALYNYMVEQSKNADNEFMEQWYNFAKAIAPLAQQTYYNAKGIQASGEDGWRAAYFPVFFESNGRILGNEEYNLDCETRFFNVSDINGGNRSLKLVGANTIAQSYINQMSTFMAYAEFDKLMVNMFASNLAPESPYKSIGASLTEAYGENGPYEILKRYGRQLGGIDKAMKAADNDLVGKLLTNLQTGVIPLNIGVWVKQAASLEVGQAWGLSSNKMRKHLLSNMKRCAFAHENVDKIISEVPESIRCMFEARWANQQVDPNYLQTYQGMDTVAGRVVNTVGEATNKASNAATGHDFRANMMVNVIDLCTVLAKEQTMRDKWLAEGKDVNSKAYAREVYEMIHEGDPASDRHMRSDLQRTDNNFRKGMFGMFRAQPEQNESLRMTRQLEYEAEPTEENKQRRNEANKAVLSSRAAFVGLTVLFGMLMRKKDYKDKEGNFDVGELALDTVTSFLAQNDNPYITPILSRVMNKVNSNIYADEYSFAPVENLNAAMDALDKFAEKPTVYNAKQTALKVGGMVGLPVSTVYDILNAIAKTTVTDGQDVSKYVDSQIKEAKTEKANEKAKEDISNPAAWVKANKATLDTDGNGHVKAAEVQAYAAEHPDYEDVLREYWNSRYKSKCPF